MQLLFGTTAYSSAGWFILTGNGGGAIPATCRARGGGTFGGGGGPLRPAGEPSLQRLPISQTLLGRRPPLG